MKWTCELCGLEWPELGTWQSVFRKRDLAREVHPDEWCFRDGVVARSRGK